jgi:ferredoxin
MNYEVKRQKCTGCGSCTDVCPTEAIRIEDGKAVITMECVDCGACPRVCPEGAVRKLPVAPGVSNSSLPV